ncbi:UDP-N-acetylmuramate dehydrogenase [bacterium]|nr:UDP-N-acetylmuramate dehydrogenase [bacterium]
MSPLSPQTCRLAPETLSALRGKWGDRLVCDAPLSGFTRLAIGGPARLLFVAESESDLLDIYRDILAHKLPYFLLGEGSNVLVADEGLEGIVIVNRYAFPPRIEGTIVTAAGGANWHELVVTCTRAGLLGLEFGAGIPGTVGGAVYGNAGAFGQAIGDRTLSVRLVNRAGQIEERPRQAMGFAYRASGLKATGEIVLAATLQLQRGDAAAGLAALEETLRLRAEKHPPPQVRTAGSYFKNVLPVSSAPRRQAAGYFLEQVGGKQLAVGDAAMYEKHANILVNRGRATARDVLALTGELSRRVRDRFGIDLEAEVIYLCQERMHHP